MFVILNIVSCEMNTIYIYMLYICFSKVAIQCYTKKLVLKSLSYLQFDIKLNTLHNIENR